MTIFICGDSTAATYAPERAPITGWGQVIGEFLPEVTVANYAIGGRSTKSFLAEGRLVRVEQAIRPGDVMLIQFTHNDTSDLVWRHTEPYTSFAANLSIFIDTARIHGATPVLLTPIPIRCWRNGELLDAHGVYAEAIRHLAMTRNVPLIDVCDMGMTFIRQVGEEESARMYMHVEPGVYPDYPNGQTDDTHTRRYGAEVYARMAAESLRSLGLI